MLYVLTGGARSGKSSAAESLAEGLGGAVTVVAAGLAGDDAEMGRRIDAHRASRPGTWGVVELERASEWRPELRDGEAVVLECVATLVGRVMDEAAEDLALDDPWVRDVLPEQLAIEIASRVRAIAQSCVQAASERPDAHLVVVTNEAGSGVVPAYPAGRLFRDELGRANRTLIDAADGAWLLVAGRCIELTGLPTRPEPR